MNRHDRRKQAKTKLAPKPKAISALIPTEKFGPSGIAGRLFILAEFVGDTRQNSDRLADTADRQIKVRATLSKIPIVNEEFNFNLGPDDGASYILAPSSAQTIKLETHDGTFVIKKNRFGELSLIEADVFASGVDDASKKFRKMAVPMLDHLSYLTNCPVFFGRIAYSDAKNHLEAGDYVAPYAKSVLNGSVTSFPVLMMPVYALYREAQNASSSFYKFLCYFKILDGLFGALRAEVFKKAKLAGIHLEAGKLTVPDHKEIPGPFRQHIGRPIKEFFDSILTPRFRNAVAHFMTDDGGILNVSDPEYSDNYAIVILICELCVRLSIEEHERLVQTVVSG